MEWIFRADLAELGPRAGCSKCVYGIPDGDVDIAKIRAWVRALVKLAGAVTGLAQQEVVGPFPAGHEGFVFTRGDLDSIDQDDGLFSHGHNSLIMWCSR